MQMELYFIRILRGMISEDRHISDLSYIEKRKLQFPKISELKETSGQLEYAVRKELNIIILENGFLNSLKKIHNLSVEIDEKISGYPSKNNPFMFLRICCKNTIDRIVRLYLSNVALKFYWATLKVAEKSLDPKECLYVFKEDSSLIDVEESLGLDELEQMTLYSKDPLEIDLENTSKKELGPYFQYKKQIHRAVFRNLAIVNDIKRKLLARFTVEELKEMYKVIKTNIEIVDDSEEMKIFLSLLQKVVAMICKDAKKKPKVEDIDQLKIPGF